MISDAAVRFGPVQRALCLNLGLDLEGPVPVQVIFKFEPCIQNAYTVGFQSIHHHVTFFYLSDKSPKTAKIKKILLPLSAKISCDADMLAVSILMK